MGKKRSLFLVVLSIVSLMMMAIACGDDSNPGNPDGDIDGTILDEGGPGNDSGNNNGDGGPPFCPDGGCNCLNLGASCKVNSDCCSNSCNGGVCSFPNCTSDNQACSQNAQCCSGMCNMGKCQPLNNSCKTLGNSCSQSSECCSKLCKGGICSPSSFCGQSGDVCASGSDCCTGICNKPMNQQLGTCNSDPPGGPANCGLVDGILCG